MNILLLSLYFLLTPARAEDPFAKWPPEFQIQKVADVGVPGGRSHTAELMLRFKPVIRGMVQDIRAKDFDVSFVEHPGVTGVVNGIDFKSRIAYVFLGPGWNEGLAAHELTHLWMHLVGGYYLASPAKPTSAATQVAANLTGDVDDSVVFTKLVDGGYKLEQVINPAFFNRVIPNAIALYEQQENRDDGDPTGFGTFLRERTLVGVELVLKNFANDLTSAQTVVLKKFVETFRQHRPEESKEADAILKLFQNYQDPKSSGERRILDPEQHRLILQDWAKISGLQPSIRLVLIQIAK